MIFSASDGDLEKEEWLWHHVTLPDLMRQSDFAAYRSAMIDKAMKKAGEKK